MAQFDNALTIVNFKKKGFDLDSFIGKTVIDSTKQTITGLLSDVVSSVGIITNNLTLNYINQIAQQILSLEGINEDSLDFYQFKINPTNFTFPRQKIMSNVLTGGGWDSDVRGQNMVNVSYSATTGSLVPKTINNVIQGLLRDLVSRAGVSNQKEITLIDKSFKNISPKYNDLIYQMASNPKLSTRYLKFLLFDTFWRYNDDDLLIVWEDNAYIGKFLSFDFRPDANKPWEIQYNFSIAVYPDFTYNIYTGAITNDLERIKRRFNIPSAVDTLTTASNNDSDSLIESTFNWFKEQGTQAYNKKLSEFLSNSNIYTSKEVDNLSPEDLAKAYRTSSGDFIDIFEEQQSLKMKLYTSRILQQEPDTVNAENRQAVDTLKEFPKETEINEGEKIIEG